MKKVLIMKFKRNPKNVTLLRDLNRIEKGNIFNMYYSEMRARTEKLKSPE